MTRVIDSMKSSKVRSGFEAGMKHQKKSSVPKAKKSIKTFIKKNKIKGSLWG